MRQVPGSVRGSGGLKGRAPAAENWSSMPDRAPKAPAPPPWMPIITALRGNKRLRRIEYRVVRVPEKDLPVVLCAYRAVEK
jgi:hypothetical protein